MLVMFRRKNTCDHWTVTDPLILFSLAFLKVVKSIIDHLNVTSDPATFIQVL